jgi:hypothetical protein
MLQNWPPFLTSLTPRSKNFKLNIVKTKKRFEFKRSKNIDNLLALEVVGAETALLTFSIRTPGERCGIAVGELLTLFDGVFGPVHNVAAIRHLVHAGVASVVDQTAGQVHHTAECNARYTKSPVVRFEGKNGLVVEHDHQ